jgi:hypothetical protein
MLLIFLVFNVVFFVLFGFYSVSCAQYNVAMVPGLCIVDYSFGSLQPLFTQIDDRGKKKIYVK